MRAEVPDDAHVRLMESEVHPARRDEVDLTELAGVDQALDDGHGWAVEERVAGHEHEAGRLSRSTELFNLFGRRRQRLLDERVLAGLERRHRQGEVGRDRSRDRHGVDVLGAEHLLEARCAGDAGIPA